MYVCFTISACESAYLFYFHESWYKRHSIVSLICDNTVTTQNVWFFQERLLKVLKCYNFVRVQRRHNCSPAASFANCVMTLYLLKVHLQTFLSIPITKKGQILIYDTLVANERYFLWGKATAPFFLWPVTDVFQWKIRWAVVQLCFVRVR
jgi:hypothetical protein